MGSLHSQEQMVALGVVFLVLPTIFVGLRIWAKTLGRAGIWWDDYLIFMALGFAIGACVAQIVAAIHGQLGQHQTVGPDGQPILDDPRFLVFERSKFALQMLAYLGLGAAKASILFLYMRIFDRERSFRLCSQIMLWFVATWVIMFFLTTLLQCIPITALVEPFYGNTCLNTIPFYYAGSISDIVIDFMILAMPIPMVWKLQLRIKQKIGVLAMFLLGVTTCAASIARLAIFIQVGEDLEEHFNDATYYISPVFLWTVIEMALSVMSACLPTLRPIYLRFNPPPATKSMTRSTFSNPTIHKYGRHPYGYADPMSEDFEVPLTGRLNSVQTHIATDGTGHSIYSDKSRGAAIMVSNNISSTVRPAEQV